MSIVVPTDAYCTLNEVLELLPDYQLDGESRPTLQQCQNIIKDKALQINAVLRGNSYTVPLTDAQDVALLKYINKVGAAYMIELSVSSNRDEISQTAEEYKEEFASLMQQLKNGEITFAGAGASETDEAASNTDLSTSGQRSQAIFRLSKGERDNQF